MKFGYRKPSIKKSIRARTTGQMKRALKRSVVPGYGKKGMGWVKDPKKAMYNKVYHQTTRSVYDRKGSGCLLFVLATMVVSAIIVCV